MTKLPPIVDSASADQLVVRSRTQREAFGELYDLTYPPVFRYCLRRTANRGFAEEVSSAVFLSVAEKIKGFGGSTYVDFRRWVFTIATNEINAHYRKSIRRKDLLEQAARSGRLQAEPNQQPDAEVDSDILQAALMQLSERAQTIITLRFFSELPYEDIGKILNTSAGAVRTAASRAIEKIRSELRIQNENQ